MRLINNLHQTDQTLLASLHLPANISICLISWIRLLLWLFGFVLQKTENCWFPGCMMKSINVFILSVPTGLLHPSGSFIKNLIMFWLQTFMSGCFIATWIILFFSNVSSPDFSDLTNLCGSKGWLGKRFYIRGKISAHTHTKPSDWFGSSYKQMPISIW